jgi:hypothetical protein
MKTLLCACAVIVCIAVVAGLGFDIAKFFEMRDAANAAKEAKSFKIWDTANAAREAIDAASNSSYEDWLYKHNMAMNKAETPEAQADLLIADIPPRLQKNMADLKAIPLNGKAFGVTSENVGEKVLFLNREMARLQRELSKGGLDSAQQIVRLTAIQHLDAVKSEIKHQLDNATQMSEQAKILKQLIQIIGDRDAYAKEVAQRLPKK